jgi:hypothetical protein
VLPDGPNLYSRATAMSEERRLKFVALQTGEGFSEGTDGGDFEDQAMDIDDVLRGDVQFDISNAGGEFEEEVRASMNQAKCVSQIFKIFGTKKLY